MMLRRILIVGGTGNFGRRLAENLTRVADVELLIASRCRENAQTIVSQLPAGATASAVTFDRAADVAAQLNDIKPWLVIDASGPFQGAGYGLARAALECGVHFIDLADARDYLMGFADALDALAKSQGLVALAGASSTPALSSAVVSHLTKGWQRVDTIDMAIAPDGQGSVGRAVIEAIAGYAGSPVTQIRFGRIGDVPGWMDSRVVDLPGVGKRRVAAVETIDAELLSRKFNVTSRVAFFAGLESRLEMWGLSALARLRRAGLVKDLRGLAPLLQRGRNFTRQFQGKRGGMLVEVAGVDENGAWSSARWSLLAGEGQGLNVPGLPVVAAVRLLMQDKLKAGAHIADDLPLQAIEAEFGPLSISTQVITKQKPSAFSRALGPAMAKLPPRIIDLHEQHSGPVWLGEAETETGHNLVTRLIARIVGLPRSGTKVPVRVTIERGSDGEERWTREFAGQKFHSIMRLGDDGKIWESFGLTSFKLDLRVENGKLIYPLTEGRVLGIPLPRWLVPRSDTCEFVDEQGRFNFSVKVDLPLLGLLARYEGWLKPQQGGAHARE